MAENFDRFPSNLAETQGPIARESFRFHYSRFEVWQGGKCIKSGDSKSIIETTLTGKELLVILNDPLLHNHIKPRFSFGEISTNIDRIMWSRDIFDSTGVTDHNRPDICSLFFRGGVLSKVTFTIHDPNTLIEFYSDNPMEKRGVTDIESWSKQAIQKLQQGQDSEGRSLLINIFRSVRQNAGQLKEIEDYESCGVAFLLMLNMRISDDIDNLQIMSSVGYLCLSKALEKQPESNRLKLNRVLILEVGSESIFYTVMSAFHEKGMPFLSSMAMDPFEARLILTKMKFADLMQIPIQYLQMDIFTKMKNEFIEKIRDEFFYPEKTIDEVTKSGYEYHKKLYEYLRIRVFHNEDIDF
jgi:hypothetical protein